MNDGSDRRSGNDSSNKMVVDRRERSIGELERLHEMCVERGRRILLTAPLLSSNEEIYVS
jgi:hypothetical protein